MIEHISNAYLHYLQVHLAKFEWVTKKEHSQMVNFVGVSKSYVVSYVNLYPQSLSCSNNSYIYNNNNNNF